MKRASLLTLVVVACLATSAPASAADRYASPSGTGPMGSCPQNDPCSLAYALNNAQLGGGDNVILAPGTYTISSSLDIGVPVNVHGTGKPSDTKIVSSYALGYPVSLNYVGATLSDLEISSTSTFPALFAVSGTVNRVIVRSSGSSACSGGNATFINTLCHSTASGGHGFHADWNNGTRQITAYNDTFVGGPSGYGVNLASSNAADVTMNAYNVIATGGSGGVSVSADGAAGTLFSAVYSNYATLVSSGTGLAGGTTPGFGTNQITPPVFTNAPAGDFTPAAGSPTIDAGNAESPSGTLDLARNVRTYGAAMDIGAYEFVPSPPAAPPAQEAPAARDTTAPKVTVTKKPKSKTTSTKLKAVFSADEAATFQCKLDKGSFKACTSPYKKTVKTGKHKLQIKATDAAGNVSLVNTLKWTVNKK